MNLSQFIQNNKDNKQCDIYIINEKHIYHHIGQYKNFLEIPINLYNNNIVSIYYTYLNNLIIFIDDFSDEDEMSQIEIINHFNINNAVSIYSFFKHLYVYHIKCEIIYNEQKYTFIYKSDLSVIPLEIYDKLIQSINIINNVLTIHIVAFNIIRNNDYIKIDSLLNISNVALIDIDCNYNKWENYGENQYVALIHPNKLKKCFYLKTIFIPIC